MRNIIKYLLTVLILFYSIVNVNAATVLNDGSAVESSGGGLTPVDTDSAYVEAINTFTDNVDYYFFVTHDEKKSNVSSVKYKEIEYSLSTNGVAVVPENFDFQSLTINGIRVFGPSSPGNITVFFDDGIYNDTISTNYTTFSVPNLSVIGLNKINGEPATTISRDPRVSSNPAINDTMERNTIAKKNIYIENITFDGKNKDMYPVGGGTGFPKTRGEYFISINGGTSADAKDADGFVLKEVIIQNVGASTSDPSAPFFGSDYRNKNIAINTYINAGQVNIEDIIIRNIKTTESTAGFLTSAMGYGVISQNQGANVNYKNITIDASDASPNSYSFKIEHMKSNQVPITEQNITLAGEINLPTDPYHNHIYVQDANYDHINVPTTFKYANWSISNGTSFKQSFDIYKEYADIPVATNSHFSIHDLNDDYWIIDVDKFNLNGQGITDELTQILSVINYAGNNAPSANIKLISSTIIPSFTVPDAYGNMAVNIVALPSISNAYTDKTLVPVEIGAIITLPTGNNVKLYNFDFHTNANYTLKEAVEGTEVPVSITDPAEALSISGYPVYSGYYISQTPKIINSTVNTFVNDQFTVLAKTLEITTKKASLVIGATSNEAATLNTGVTLLDDVDRTKIDDISIIWYSSDSSIASIDSNGVITANTTGTVTIYAKALDMYNQGEVEKPFDSYTLIIVENTPPVITTQNMTIMKNDSTFNLMDLVISASDKEDVLLSKNDVIIVDNGGFDISVPGVYTVIYSVTDSGNITTQATAVVTVVEAGPPVINTHNTSIIVGTEFNDTDILGLVDSAYDFEGNDIKKDVTILDKGGFDYNVVGDYVITYTVTDKNGLTETNTALIQVLPIDTPINYPPQILAHGTTIYEGDPLDLVSLVDSALDQNGADLTGSVTYDDGGFDNNVPGTYVVTYKVEDLNTGLSTITKVIVIVKPRIPTITAHGKTIVVGTELDLLTLVDSASDPVSGDLKGTSAVTITNDGGFNKDIVGSYSVEFTVTNEIGKTSKVTVVVNVVKKPNNPPVILAHGTTINVGTSLDLLSLVDSATDIEDGDLKSSVVIENDGGFNKDVAGSYIVTFMVKDKEGLIGKISVVVYVIKPSVIIPVNPSTPTPGRTCQDDGYPEGYYWSDEKQACVIDMPVKYSYKVPPTSVEETFKGYTLILLLSIIFGIKINKRKYKCNN